MNKKTKVSAKDIYKELVDSFKIKNQIGSIQIKLGNITAKYNGKDAIGDLLQEWIEAWMKSKNYYFRTKVNTQEFPDFLLDEANDKGLLEIKTFNANKGPAFDIAAFDSYCKSLLIHPERLDADYLIISYKMIDSALTIKEVWLKKVWEIAGTSDKYFINVQAKNYKLDNIRPVLWYLTSKRLKNVPFKSKTEFIEAISNIHNSYSQCDTYKDNWLTNVKTKYEQNTGTKF